MDCLTSVGKRFLPDGRWTQSDIAGDSLNYACLTFDDGPDPQTTPLLLELLDQAQVKATFFLIGSKAARHEDLLAKIAGAGHTIGNHTYNHQFMPGLSTRQIECEIDKTQALIESVTGKPARLFRPPFGIMDGRAARLLAERRVDPVYWGSVPLDWEVPGAGRVVARVMRRLASGTLIVLHEGRDLAKQTISAAKEIICKGHEQGYAFVSLRGPGDNGTEV